MMFSEFKGVTKADWLEKIEHDLKGRSFDDLKWHLNENISMDPVYMASDFENSPLPIPKYWKNWKIAEHIRVIDNKEANGQLISALEGGVNAPILTFKTIPTLADLLVIFEGVHLDMIYLQIDGLNNAADWHKFILNFVQYIDKLPIHNSAASGMFKIDPSVINNWLTDNNEFIHDLMNQLPCFNWLYFDGKPYFQGVKHVDSELSSIFKNAVQFVQSSLDNGLINTGAIPVPVFELSGGPSFYVEIAKIRALKLLWGNLLKQFNLNPEVPIVAYQADTKSMSEEPTSNMIQNTTQAMAAIMGGADIVLVPPASQIEQELPFQKRIGRNVQHLLALESHLDIVQDPVAGSYFIEKLTNKFTAAIWTNR